MKKTVAIYAIALAGLAFILNLVEYKFLIRDLRIEFYIGLLALLFTGMGIWIGQKLTSPKEDATTKTARNKKAIAYLGISQRELEVLELVAEGLSNKQIAERLYVSINTVKTHLSNLYSKMDVNRRTEAVEKARSLNIIAH
ncbi:MAG: response regulator transcription factor [Balneolaceae bacterium]|nr:response regulator transcription factor [Balneolaceae bacterium]